MKKACIRNCRTAWRNHCSKSTLCNPVCQVKTKKVSGLTDEVCKHDEIQRNDCSRLPLCNQFHQVNAGTIPGFTTVLPTWDKYDEIGILQIDGTLRHYNHLERTSVPNIIKSVTSLQTLWVAILLSIRFRTLLYINYGLCMCHSEIYRSSY